MHNSTVIRKRSNNASDELGQCFEYVDVTTSTTDYYELWGQLVVLHQC